MFSFNITARDPHSKARAGILETPHGKIRTPCFMPCGTKGAVKTLTPDELQMLGCEIILCNTFHLMLRPGAELIEKMGGLHKWIGWDKPMLTDSGGFQVFSLAKLRNIDDDGVTFKSPIDGSSHRMTPELAVEIQEKIGADIIMAFDECPPATCTFEEAARAMHRTHAWLERCMKAKKRKYQALFPIVQGAVFPELRKQSATFISQIEAAGYAIGGVAVGESKEQMREVVSTVAPLLPEHKPRYLMGVGEPDDLRDCINMGIDMFDCVLPTRLARHGSFWNKDGIRENLMRSEYRIQETPLDSSCTCYTCSRFSSSYVRHLMEEKEMLGHRLLTLHNLHFLLEFVRKIRENMAV